MGLAQIPAANTSLIGVWAGSSDCPPQSARQFELMRSMRSGLDLARFEAVADGDATLGAMRL